MKLRVLFDRSSDDDPRGVVAEVVPLRIDGANNPVEIERRQRIPCGDVIDLPMSETRGYLIRPAYAGLGPDSSPGQTHSIEESARAAEAVARDLVDPASALDLDLLAARLRERLGAKSVFLAIADVVPPEVALDPTIGALHVGADEVDLFDLLALSRTAIAAAIDLGERAARADVAADPSV